MAYRGGVYIAGPMRGRPYYNFPAFDAARDTLKAAGVLVVSPADLDRAAGFDAMTLTGRHDWNAIPQHFDLDACIDRDIKALRTCLFIYALDGWETSVGASAEMAIARWANLRRVDRLGRLIPWQCTDEAPQTGTVRTFDTGACRDLDETKPDYEGFLAPQVLCRFAEYMHKHRKTAAGLRASDNWQKGIPKDSLMQSGLRHVMDWWLEHRGLVSREGVEEALCGVLFNANAYLLALLKERHYMERKDAGKPDEPHGA